MFVCCFFFLKGKNKKTLKYLIKKKKGGKKKTTKSTFRKGSRRSKASGDGEPGERTKAPTQPRGCGEMNSNLGSVWGLCVTGTAGGTLLPFGELWDGMGDKEKERKRERERGES